MRIEQNLLDNEPRIVSGVKGVKSRSFTKKFKNQAAMEKWFDSDAATDVSVYEIARA